MADLRAPLDAGRAFADGSAVGNLAWPAGCPAALAVGPLAAQEQPQTAPTGFITLDMAVDGLPADAQPMGDLLGAVGGDDMVLYAAPGAPGDGSGVARATGLARD